MADRRAEVSVKITTEMLRGSPIGESLERIASLLVQLYVDAINNSIGLRDKAQSPDGEEGEVMAWAVATAGHLFMAGELRRCGLLPQESQTSEGTVYGIRPHRPLTAHQDALQRQAMEQLPPLSRDEAARQILGFGPGEAASDGA